ncbi:uncharacterized protein LOC120454959 [Drosophila santomea]|uniref:uncharacterized protein LOC120454959 n=1 Tax=Drosophila santomea TaxID=129105 RepID=UPI001952D222|nr:uncharacterized protein LOC120454959 [Drosophila santomea]
MSYQIKSTPYFRRMFNKSKKNGQLQRLRDEYERIQEFNDRTIELKMRQVRLKRLFREIEVIKVGGNGAAADSGAGAGAGAGASTSGASSGTMPPAGGAGQSTSFAGGRITRRRPPHTTSRLANTTPQQRSHVQRVETLARARLLGQEISRRNGQMAEAGTGGFLRSELRMTAKVQAATDARRAAVERRERAAKRISYGNDQSRQNMQRLLLLRQRRHAQAAAPVAAPVATTVATVARPRPHANAQVPITQQLPSRLYPDYRQLTPSQLQLLAASSSGRSTAAADAGQQLEQHGERQEQPMGDSVQVGRDQDSYSDHSFHTEDWMSPSLDAMDSEDEREMRELMDQMRQRSRARGRCLELGRVDAHDDREEEVVRQRSLRVLHMAPSPVGVSHLSFSSTGTQTTNPTRRSYRTTGTRRTTATTGSTRTTGTTRTTGSTRTTGTTRTTGSTRTTGTTGTLVTAATSPVNVAHQCVASNVEIPHTNEIDAAGCSQSATIASHQPSGMVPPPPPPLEDEPPTDTLSNSSRWHQISLMLPWFRAFPDLPTDYAVAPPPDVPMSCDSSGYDVPPSAPSVPTAPQRMYMEQSSEAATQAAEEPFSSANCQRLLSAIKFNEAGAR